MRRARASKDDDFLARQLLQRIYLRTRIFSKNSGYPKQPKVSKLPTAC